MTLVDPLPQPQPSLANTPEQKAARLTRRLAKISLNSGCLGLVCVVLFFFLALVAIIGTAFGWGRGNVWTDRAAIVASLVLPVAVLAPIIALTAGLVVMLRTRQGVGAQWRRNAFFGIFLGGLPIALVVALVVRAIEPDLSDDLFVPTAVSMQAVENALVNNGFVRTPELDGTCTTLCWQYENGPLYISATVYLVGGLDGLNIWSRDVSGVSFDLQTKVIRQVVCAAYPAELCSEVSADLPIMYVGRTMEYALCGDVAGYYYNVHTYTRGQASEVIEHGVDVWRGAHRLLTPAPSTTFMGCR